VSSDLGIVIPIGPGEASGATLLESLQALAPDWPLVVVYAQGDAQRRPPDLPSRRCIDAPAGRAAQQNAGAAALSTPHLCFLHADTVIDAAAIAALRRFVASEARALGYFDLRFVDGPPLMALTATAVRWRCRLFGLPFGDQGLCLPRADFLTLGGFDSARGIGEDHALVWQARRAGLRVRPIGATLGTSARKYVRDGWWRTTWRHQCWTWTQAWREWRA
jgi:hypothetical protein